jgi:hypothetical protein
VTRQNLPVGLLLLGVLLLILALRALGWVVIGSLLAQRTLDPAEALTNLLTALVLLVTTVGLLRLREWARWLALAACSAYFGLTLVNVLGLWPRLRGDWMNLGLGVLNAMIAVSVLAFVWWYLNRRDVRRLFQRSERGPG